MKFSLPALVFTLLLISVSASAEQKITGKDWILMTRDEKGTYIFTAMEILRKHDVPLSKTPAQYTSLIDSKLIDNPDALQSDPTNILATIVYENEPAAREALDKIKKTSL